MINVWGYLDEYHEERADILEAVDRAFSSGKLVLGDNVRSFEQQFATWCGAAHGIGVDNGTNAIELALRAVGVRPGDEVITVSNTAAPTVVAIHAAGARARFVDIDPQSYLMDVDLLEQAITPKTTCIVPVHLFGQCVDMDAVQRVSQRHGLPVVEDCAQAHGATYKGRMAGSMGDAAAFSFYPTKVLGAYGDGGMVTTCSDEIAQTLRRLRYYGMDDRYYVVEPGKNSRLDEVQAAILNLKLQRIDTYIKRRQQLARMYEQKLTTTALTLPYECSSNRHVYYLYVARHPRRDFILEELKKEGINLNVSYRWPVHLMSGFADLGYEPGMLPNTEAAAAEIFSLPMYPSLADEDQELVCDQLTALMGKL